MKIMILLLMVLLTIPIALAGTPHTTYGYVSNADDGTLSDGSTVTAYIEGKESETLTDIVGLGGNSQVENGWLIDTGNFPTEWSAEEKLVIKVEKEGYNAKTEVILNSEVGNQQAENMTLKKVEVETTEETINTGGGGTGSSQKSSPKVIEEEQTASIEEKQMTNEELTQPELEAKEVEKQEVTANATENTLTKSLMENKNSKNLYYLIPIIIVIAVIAIYLFLKNRGNKK